MPKRRRWNDWMNSNSVASTELPITNNNNKKQRITEDEKIDTHKPTRFNDFFLL